MKWGIRILILAVIVVVCIVAWQMTECRKKGKASGGAFKCKLFKSEPEYLNPVRQYFKMKDDGKCYKIMDYGNRMSFKETDRINCMR